MVDGHWTSYEELLIIFITDFHSDNFIIRIYRKIKYQF